MKTLPNEPATGYGFTTADGSSHVQYNGLTKREYFAAMAMQGMLSNSEIICEVYCTNLPIIAQDAVKAADELISQLNK